MAHRLAFSPNQRVPLAVRINHEGAAHLTPAVDGEVLSASELGEHQLPKNPVQTNLNLLALDVTSLDHEIPSEDSISFRLAFQDTLGRRVEINSQDVIPGFAGQQHFGGVATNLGYIHTGTDGHSTWRHQPLVAWMQCDIRVNDALTDASMVGVVTLTDGVAPQLQVQITPQSIVNDEVVPLSLQAAEELGMPGWVFTWNDVAYCQAPVMSVRVERGDSLEKVAKEMAVDYEAVLQANDHLEEGDDVIPGDLLRVPMFTKASSRARRKEHPSVALTWKEIVKGWTTLNHN